MGSGRRDSCREFLRQLNILPVQSQYILPLLLFVKNRGKEDQFLSNLEVHDISTRNNSNLHLPLASLTLYQKEFFYAGSKSYNNLPLIIKYLPNAGKCFKTVLKKYLADKFLL
jgi:hypothetical protein